jgi:hypothetical protein
LRRRVGHYEVDQREEPAKLHLVVARVGLEGVQNEREAALAEQPRLAAWVERQVHERPARHRLHVAAQRVRGHALEHRREAAPGALHGGQRRRVARVDGAFAAAQGPREQHEGVQGRRLDANLRKESAKKQKKRDKAVKVEARNNV